MQLRIYGINFHINKKKLKYFQNKNKKKFKFFF